MVSVSSLGVGSGIDLQSLVDGLVASEANLRLGSLDVKEGAANERLSAYGVLRSSLSEFESSVQSLANLSTFQKRNVSVSNSDALSISASSNSPLGTFAVEVTQLGQNQQLTAAGLVDVTGAAINGSDVNIGGGTLTLQQSGKAAFSLSIDPSASSLEEIASAINSATDNTGISASAITGDAGTVLVLSADQSGSGNTITVTVDDIDGDDSNALGLSQLAYDTGNAITPVFTETQGALDSIITVSGQTITSTSGNTFNDVLTGVSITALEVTTQAESFTISKNLNDASEAVAGFVEAYNTLAESISSLGSAGVDGVGGGALVGDSVLRGINSQLRQAIFTQFTVESTSSVRALSDIGIGFTREGNLELDSSALSSQLNENFEEVVALLTASGDTVALSKTYNSSAFADLASQPGDITLAFDDGEDSFSVDVNGLDLIATRDAINNAVDNIGVTASVVVEDNGAGGTQARLIVSADQPGSDFSIEATNNADSSVVSLFTQSQGTQRIEALGALANIENIIDTYLEGSTSTSATGILGAKIDGVNAEIERIGDERILQTRRLEDYEARLTAQYAALDLLVANLNSNGDFLISQLNSISQISNNSNSN